MPSASDKAVYVAGGGGGGGGEEGGGDSLGYEEPPRLRKVH